MVLASSILLADDEATFRESTCRLLRREGYECEGVCDADEAMAKLRQKPFDLLIADASIRKNGEMRLVREVQRLHHGMPVILVTGHPSLDTAISAVGSPVTAYLIKPIGFPDLLSHVRPSIERSRKRRVVTRVRERLRQCLAELECPESDCGPQEVGPADLVDAVSMATIRTLAASLSELLEVRATPDRAPGSKALCELLDCPQLPEARNMIEESIEVLKRTKGTFKSKELAQLRTKLEKAVRDPDGQPCRADF